MTMRWAGTWPELLAAWEFRLRCTCGAELEDEGLSGPLGAPGASEDELSAAETRLGRRLPESYRAFLAASNGWAFLGPNTTCGGPLRPASEIERFDVENREWIDAYIRPMEGVVEVDREEHAVYGLLQESSGFRRAYLEHCIQIGDVTDSGVYLLNPAVEAADGEWEAWHFANWMPGARRHPSFRHLVEELAQLAGKGEG